MVVTIHSIIGSPPCRSVLLTAKAVGAPINVKEVDLLNGGARTPEYLKMNPQHTVPTMEDNGLVLAESRAIMEYLVDAYGKTDALYPKVLKKRALVNARMYFDATSLYPKLATAYLAPLFRGTERSDANVTALNETLEILDTLIGSNLYLVGEQLTIADITTAVTISNGEACGHDFSKFKNVSRWYENAKKVIPGYVEINQKGADMVAQYHKQKFGSE